MVVRDRAAMVAGMTPVLRDGVWVFCTLRDPGPLAAQAFALIREDEGVTLILPRDRAVAEGFDVALPMVRIVLEVHSALDGVGLTAAVAGVLADHGIPCNMVAGFHHDHVFVPEAMGVQALTLLLALQRAG